jgi:16S rRNA (guanine966-N2)-methyltransferase
LSLSKGLFKAPRTAPAAAPKRNLADGRVRIIGGAWRSRVVRFPGAEDLRPTADRVRETVFNWLGQDLTGHHCLDLFAGSGALGFEALSRGAKSVVMVERDARARAALSANANVLDETLLTSGRLTIIAGDALQFLRSAVQPTAVPFDVIFCDPPFREEWFARLLPLLRARLTGRGMVYAESGTPVASDPVWTVRKSGKAGQVFFSLLEPIREVAAGVPS